MPELQNELSIKNIEILYLDDDDRHLDLLDSYFKTKGCNIITTKSISQAVAHTLDHFTNIFLCDLSLEATSVERGFDILTLMRKKNNEAFLALITAYSATLTGNEMQKLSDNNIKIYSKGDYELLYLQLTKDYYEHVINKIKDKTTILAKEELSRITQKDVKHVFISYRRSDWLEVMKIVDNLRENGISVWIDKESILPGQDWQIAIKKAIEDGMFFIACFSKNYWESNKNYMNEELQIAIDQLRKVPDDKVWFIPVKLDNCEIPYFEIRQNKTLNSKQFVTLYDGVWKDGINKILKIIKST